MKRILLRCTAAACLQLALCHGAFAEGAPITSGRPSPLTGQGPVEVDAHPDPLSLLQDADPEFAANKRLVFDMWRSIVNAGHVDLADEMLQEDYIQHSPILPTGRTAFKGIFSVVPKTDIPELVSPPLVAILAEGNLVVMALREELPEPGGSGKYTTTHFNLFRIQDHRLAEHWHSIQDAPGADVLPPDKGGPQRVTGLTGSARQALLRAENAVVAAHKQLVFDYWNSAVTHSPGSYLDEDFVEHDPNSGAAQAGPPMGNEAPIVAVLAQGDFVVLVTALEHPHPIRPGETYTTTWFDMFRIAGGRIAEHWNGASKPGTSTIQYGSQ